jgi:drug/metabolite transporter (DMT)-like permease
MNSLAGSTQVRRSNLAGILAMLTSMATFTVNDTCIKLLNAHVPLGEIICLRNGAATLIILSFAAVAGGLTLPKDAPVKLLSWRMAAEVASTLFFLSALVRMPIADATAIAQCLPLVMTAAAAIYLKEPVGWRRWLAAIVGFFGVMLIVKPGSGAFSAEAVLILIAVVLVAGRDLITRAIHGSVPTLTLTLMSAASVMPSGLALLPFETWVWPSLREVALVLVSGLNLTAGYALIVVAMRAGDVAVIAPFRYAVILFGLISGYAVWGQLPDGIQMLGIAILTLAGIYTFHRERLAATV